MTGPVAESSADTTLADGAAPQFARYATQDEAVAARRNAELEHYGEVCP